MSTIVNTLKELPSRFSFIKFIFLILQIAAVVVVVWGSANTILSGFYTNSQWFDLVIFGLSQGSVYALIALGYTMVYGILRFINFAHGEIFMSGTIIGFLVSDTLASSGFWESAPFLSLVIALIASMGASALVAYIVERLAYRPLREAPRLIPLITSIGMSFILQNIFRGVFGSGIKTYPSSPLIRGKFVFGEFGINYTDMMVIGTAFIMMLGLYFFIESTKMGKAMRAVAEDKEIAALMGIDVNKVIVTTFIIGGLLAGTAGFLFGQVFRAVNYFSGFIPGIKAFTAAVLGGVGNVVGAMLGGLVLGLAESLGPNLVLFGLGIPAPHQLKDVVAFTVLVLVLIFRPSGLLGERLSEEKA